MDEKTLRGGHIGAAQHRLSARLVMQPFDLELLQFVAVFGFLDGRELEGLV